MVDDIDRAAEMAEANIQIAIAAARKPVAIGAPGTCVECEVHSPRLVGGRCAPCRDGN